MVDGGWCASVPDTVRLKGFDFQRLIVHELARMNIHFVHEL